MKKLLILFVLFAASSVAQDYVVNKKTLQGYPSEVFVGRIPLDEIPVDLIVVTTEVPNGIKILAGRVGLKYLKVDYGQPTFPHEGVYSKQLCISQKTTSKTRILAESIVFFNILKQNGWDYKDQIGMGGSFQFLFEKKQ